MCKDHILVVPRVFFSMQLTLYLYPGAQNRFNPWLYSHTKFYVMYPYIIVFLFYSVCLSLLSKTCSSCLHRQVFYSVISYSSLPRGLLDWLFLQDICVMAKNEKSLLLWDDRNLRSNNSRMDCYPGNLFCVHGNWLYFFVFEGSAS